MTYARVSQAEGLNWWESDLNLQQVVRRYASPEVMAWAWPYLSRFGELVSTRLSPRADFTDRAEGRPRLVAYDRQGEEISKVVYNPGYLQSVADVYGSGIVAWRHRAPAEAPGAEGQAPGAPGAEAEALPHVITYAMGYLLAMAETGLYCPVALTASTALVVDRYAPPDLKGRYLPGLIATDPDRLTQGATWLTEKSGGSDVGAITTVARLDGDTWRLTGEKWFASNADAPLALVLARPEGAPESTAGLALFLLPSTLPDGRRNHYRIRRLKEKLGVLAVPSGEVLLEGAEAYLIGGPGHGFRMMMEALNLSRIMNAIASSGLARRAWLESAIYSHQRIAFGKRLIDHPLMRRRLFEMLVDQEASTALAFRAAGAYERAEPIHRLLIPIAKARTGALAVRLASQGIECFGGNGYIEEFPMARLLRDAQVLTVWEGPSNILALECLRVLAKQGPADLLDEVERRIPLDAGLASVRDVLVGGLADLKAALGGLAAADPTQAQYLGVRLLNLMADLLSTAYLAEEAATGDPRKALIARGIARKLHPHQGWELDDLDRQVLEGDGWLPPL